MKTYFDAFKIFRDSITHDQDVIIPYVWQQKHEITALLDISSSFWVILDYTIHITSIILKNPKEQAEREIQQILRPIFERYNAQIQKMYLKIPDVAYCYTKEEIKTFHHIVSHTINLMDKKLAHFIPSYLFISSIEHMNILHPRHEYTIHPGMLARRNYPLLLSRHIAHHINKELFNIINFLLWYREISPLLLPDERKKLCITMINMITKAINTKTSFSSDDHYSMQQLIVELREVITSSLISEKLHDILDDIKHHGDNKPLDTTKYLAEIVTLFISPSAESNKYNTMVRDLSIVINILDNIKAAFISKDKNKLFSNIYLGKSLEPVFSSVTAYLFEPAFSLEFLKFCQLIDFLHTTYPSFATEKKVIPLIDSLIDVIGKEKDIIASRENISVTQDDIVLFIDKVNKLRAR